MKIHTTNYKNTFIEVAEDSPVLKGEIPPVKRNRTLAEIQFEMISNNPYKYTSDEVMLACYVQKNDIPESEIIQAKNEFFSKGQPCFRSSALAKRYGFGIHHDEDGKIAIFSVESVEYERFVNDDTIKKVKAMRAKRAQ